MSAAEVVGRAVAVARDCSNLNALWYLDGSRAEREALAVDAAVRNGGGAGRLAGAPIVVKDAFDVADMPGGAGGPVEVAVSDADAVRACRREGAIIIGKGAMDQLGWGMSGQSPGRPECRNPAAPGHQPGGSSSGPAVAVAAGIVNIALGADTGGSIRLPAAWCGVVGFKPAQSSMSRVGLAPLADRFDTIGYLASSVDDCSLVHEALSGRPGVPPDPWSTAHGLRVATDPALYEDADPEVVAAFKRGLERLRACGSVIVGESLPPHRIPLGSMYAAELASNWGDIVESRAELFREDVRAGVAAGRAADPQHVAEGWAQRAAMRHDATLSADVFACPTTPKMPPALSAPDDVPRVGRLLRPFNVLDWPAISVPCPGSPKPVGFQLAAPRGRDSALFALARALEGIT